MAKDLGQGIEDMEEGIENLKNKEFRVLGIKVTFMSVSALVAIVGSVLGSLYGGFLMYQKVEEVAGLDVGAFEQRMEIIETKLDEAIDYSRDIKNGLKDDIVRIEKQVDRTEDMVRDSEQKVREIVDLAEQRFENKRDQLQNDYDQKADRLRDTTDQKIKDLEDRLNKKLQRALDNPLAN